MWPARQPRSSSNGPTGSAISFVLFEESIRPVGVLRRTGSVSHDWDCAASKSSRLRDPCDDIRAAVDEELRRLAEKYRTAVVLCDLEGKTRKEVARQLGLAEGIVASRLARGRSILAKRLARR